MSTLSFTNSPDSWCVTVANKPGPGGGSTGGFELETAEQLAAKLEDLYMTKTGRIKLFSLGSGIAGGIVLIFTHLQLLGQEAIQTAFSWFRMVTIPVLKGDVEEFVADVGTYLSGLFDPIEGFGVLGYPVNLFFALVTFAVLALAVRWAWRFFGGDR